MIGQEVLIRTVTGGGTDAYGDPLPSTTTDTPIQALVSFDRSNEASARGRSGVVVGLSLYITPPPIIPLTPADKVVVDGLEYEALMQVSEGSLRRPRPSAVDVPDDAT